MSYPANGGLDGHRRSLADNPDSFSSDRDRTCQNWCNEAWKYVRVSSSLRRGETIPILRQMADMVWDAQGGRPLFQFMGNRDLPMSWNRPQDGERNYIRYEIGHLCPRLAGGDSHPNNLSFQSSRCNQHIQSSLNIGEVMVYFENVIEVQDRLNTLRSLHDSLEWNDLLSQLNLAD